jgi:hypothetical protein
VVRRGAGAVNRCGVARLFESITGVGVRYGTVMTFMGSRVSW